MNRKITKLSLYFLIVFLAVPLLSQAQFIDEFEDGNINRWSFFTGDGNATMDFTPKNDFARILVDATSDQHNVWWAIIKRNVAPALDLSKLKDEDHELRIEAKVRLSDAPRRINFMINTQRTTDFHKHLLEYDIADTTDWHVISMTTQDLDAVPGDSLFVQLGVTDWGLEHYHVDVEYYRADIVDVNEVGPDKGEPLPYHPPVPELETFSHHLKVAHDGVIHTNFPNVNFNDWKKKQGDEYAHVLTAQANQWSILRWELDEFQNRKAKGSGVLKLTTHSVAKGGNYSEVYGEELGMEFGKVRVIEILGGDADWDQADVTFNSLLEDKKPSEVFNSQMIFDAEVSEEQRGKTFITLSRPVMQRLLDGTTKGLLIKPLGAINVNFYASEYAGGKYSPQLHFNITEK